jgi:hypothetical protein
MTEPGALDSALMTLVQAIAADDATTAFAIARRVAGFGYRAL